jgi:aconitate hydratase
LTSADSLKTRRTLTSAGKTYDYFSLDAAAAAGLGDIARLPYSLKVLLENLLRWEDGRSVTALDIQAFGGWLEDRRSDREIAYHPARVLMQDFTGVPAVVDLAAMRDAVVAAGGDAKKINPLSPVDLVIDHSVTIDHFGTAEAAGRNMEMEFRRNRERYEFLRWGQTAFDNFRVVPPGTGICHQVNIEHLAQVVWTGADGENGKLLAYPDTLVGTDSHTTMANGLSVLGWGVGGIEAEAAMLGQPISMLIPQVVGVRLSGALKEGTTATDLVLKVVEVLRAHGVVGKFVEFFGPGVDGLSLPDRATIANMAPEYGATCGFFPINAETIRYLKLTARDPERLFLVEDYAKAQGLWRDSGAPDPLFTDIVELDIAGVGPSLAGPKHPQERIALGDSAAAFSTTLEGMAGVGLPRSVKVENADYDLRDGDVVIAAITSCTNTSNPSVLVAAGLLARNAVGKGIMSKPWVKTSLAPGSQVVADYLAAAGLQEHLDALGFNLAGFGCTTCIGNSGPLAGGIAEAIGGGDLVAAAVLSGNRNFEGRISPHVKANYLASPPLVVAYALAGSMRRDLLNEPLAKGTSGDPVYLKDVWPSNEEIQKTVNGVLTTEMFRQRYAGVFTGPPAWRDLEDAAGLTYDWNAESTYVRQPPFFAGEESAAVADITGALPLLILGDRVTTDHISPAGTIMADSPAGSYLAGKGVAAEDFNSYGSRRGNHQVMMRGTFANIRICNEMAAGTQGGVTRHLPTGEITAVYDAAMKYQAKGIPLVVIAGKEYGTGSSRDWAAKGTRLLGVKAVIVESFERIHRSNLIGMGVLPLQFKEGESRETLRLTGSEAFDISGLGGGIRPGMDVTCDIIRADGGRQRLTLLCRIDTQDEAKYFTSGGILHYVLGKLKTA